MSSHGATNIQNYGRNILTTLQTFTKKNFKQKQNVIKLYPRYVGDILIVFSTKKITEDIIQEKINQFYKNLELRLTTEGPIKSTTWTC